MSGSIRWFSSAREMEKNLVAAVRGWRLEDGPCSGPQRIIVPSRSLRLHLFRRLVEAHGAVVGVKVQTHFEVAREVLNRTQRTWEPGGLWSQELSRLEADAEPVLRDALGSLEDGYAAVARSVDELMDAGFEASLAEGLIERLRAWTDAGGGRVRVERAIAVVRVAERVATRLEQGGALHHAVMMQQAAIALSMDGPGVLPSERVWIVGFADATGAVTELLRALVRAVGAEIWIEDPSDPVDSSRPDLGRRFAEPFRENLAGMGLPTSAWEAPENVSRMTGMVARDSAHEARLVADRIRALLDSGINPEDVAIVARSLDGRGALVRRALGQCAVPASGVGATVSGDGSDRRARAFGDLLKLGSHVDVGRWLDAWSGSRDPARTLHTGLASLGIRRLGEVASLEPETLLGSDGALKLEARRGLERREDAVVAPRFHVSRERFKACVRSARATLKHLETWPDRAPAHVHLERVQDLVVDVLDWDWNDERLGGIRAAVEDLHDKLPRAVELERRGFVRMLRDSLGSIRRRSIGGLGGGISILDVTEARGRTFEHVFVLGLNRGVFPRVIREDPLLPDDVRRVLSAMLVDLREKRRGLDEERHLFAQLLASSPNVHLSWCRVDGEGRVVGPSSLVVGSLIGGRFEGVEDEPVFQYEDDSEFAVREGLAGSGETDSLAAIVGPDESAAFGRVIEEQQRHSAWCAADELPGPYMGFVGPVLVDADVRNRPLYVTMAEKIARCPWAAALERGLYIQSPPDPGGDLPMITRMHVGQVVHGVVEDLCLSALGGTGKLDAAESDAVALEWPDDAALEAQVQIAAIQCLRDDGIVWDGLVVPLVRQAMAALQVLQEVDEEVDGVCATEVTGTWNSPDGTPLHYRADRVEWAKGTRLVTDLKIAKPISDKKKADTRYKDLREHVRKGHHLQAAVYARDGSTGRYLYLTPDLEVRSFPIPFDDEELNSDLEACIGEVLDARRLGAWFPRVSEPSRDKTPATCDYCGVREACPVGDSGQRGRIMALAQSTETSSAPFDGAIEAMRALWRGGEEEK